MVPGCGLDAQVFVISDMVVEARDLPTGRILAFNGTTEWALDSVEAHTVVWLPREDQLRGLIGASLVCLEQVGGVDDSDLGGGWAVTVERDGRRHRELDVDAECAYARALLSLLTS